MLPAEHTYPSKRVERINSDVTARTFILPIVLHNTVRWAWLDTGANVSILPREIAEEIINLRPRGSIDGEYALAGVIRIPYQSYTLNVDILEYINDTIPNMDLTPYNRSSPTAVSLSNVRFRVPTMRWPEIADKIHTETPVTIDNGEMGWVILGLSGVLEQLSLTFVGNNAVTISSYE